MKLVENLKTIGGLAAAINVMAIILYLMYIVGEGLLNLITIGILLLFVLETLIIFFIFKALAHIVSTVDCIKTKLENETNADEVQQKQS